MRWLVPAQRIEDGLQRRPLRRATDRAAREQEVHGDQLNDQPSHILGSRLQLRGELLTEALLGPVQRVVEEALPEVLEMPAGPQIPIVEQQRAGLDQALLLPELDQGIDLGAAGVWVNEAGHLRILCRARAVQPDNRAVGERRAPSAC
jgi:hypothetical protein